MRIVLSNLMAAVVVAFILTFSSPLDAKAENYVIGLPNDYSGNQEDLQKLITMGFTSIHSGDTLTIYDAASRQRIYSLSLPANLAFDNPKLRAKQFGYTLQPLGAYIKKVLGNGAGALPSNIGLPAFLREIANSALSARTSYSAQVLVLGSAKFDDPREKAYSMLDGHFPSDGHLRVDDNVSPFGVVNRMGSLRNVNVHLCITDSDWIDELHHQRVERFWALYIGQMGGKLASFTNDLQTCAQRFIEKHTDMPERYILDPRQTKPEMLRITRETTPETVAAQELPTAMPAFESGGRFMDADIPLSDVPPASMIGRVKIGIRWDCATCDIDIYARAAQTSPFLYFGTQASSEGRHQKDYRASPDAERQFEYIDFNVPVDLGNLESYVHFYEGHASNGATGVIRLWFDGHVYEMPFHISATRGNRAATPQPELVADKPEWVKINVTDLIHLATPAVQ